MTLAARIVHTRDVGLEAEGPGPDLLVRFQGGERDAIRRVAELYWTRMRRWAWLELHDRALAEDAVQEALVRLMRFHARYDPERAFDPWIRTLVRNAARDQQPVVRRVVAQVRSWVRPPDQLVDLQRAGRRVDDLLHLLSPRQRHLVDLCLRQGLPVVEAAELLEITPSTARVHLHNARRRLAEALGDDVHAILKETP